jgi:hypothetical protein
MICHPYVGVCVWITSGALVFAMIHWNANFTGGMVRAVRVNAAEVLAQGVPTALTYEGSEADWATRLRKA